MFRRSQTSRSPKGTVTQLQYRQLEKRQLLAADFSSEPIELAFADLDHVEIQWGTETALARGDQWLIWQDESNSDFLSANAGGLAVGAEYFLSDAITVEETGTTVGALAAAPQKLEVVDEISSGLFLLSGSENFSYELVAQSVADWIPNAIVEPDFIVHANGIPNDPNFGDQWGLNNTGQNGGVADADIDAVEAWDITTGSSDVVVGVIDTGIDYTHPDLVDNIWVNPGEIANDGIDNDGNGYIDDIHGWDFANNDNNPIDDEGHGTHVAGTIGATGNNGLGVTGVSQNVSLVAVKFLDRFGSGTTSDAIRAIEYTNTLKQFGTNLVLTNNSWGGGSFSTALRNVIEDAQEQDILFVAAAGNDGSSSLQYPAGYDLDNIVSVAATNRSDELSSFSNFSTSWVDLAAPGSDILSTRAGGGYELLSGTSMASPHVAGAIALYSSVRPELTSLELKDQLLDNVDVLPQFANRVASSGRLNVHSLFDASVRFDAETYLTDGTIGGDVFDAVGFAPGATLTIESSSGDVETVAITAADATEFSFSIQSALGSVNTNDGVLQVSAADVITVSFTRAVGASPLTDSATFVSDDHGGDAGSATVLSIPFNVVGSVDVLGDQDWFQFTTVAGWNYDFEVFQGSLDASKVSIYDTDGLTLLEESNAPSISWVAPQSGTYYLSIEHGFGTGIGDYQLSGRVPNSTVAFDSSTFGTPGVVGFDLFDATGFAAGATVTIVSSSGDSETLPINAGASFEFSTSINSMEGAANQNDGVLQVASGDTLTVTYFDSEDGNGGSLTNTDTAIIFADDHGDDFASATALSLPFSVSGISERFGDQDWFSFSAVLGFRYEFEVAFDDLSGSELNLYDTDGVTRLVSNGFDSNISWIAPASGTYFLSYEGLNADESGNYQLLGFSTVPNSSIEFSEIGYYAPGTVEFSVTDATGFAPGATLLLESSSGDSETILISAGVDFTSSINTLTGTANSNDGILQVASGDTLTATYFDSDDGLGSTFTATNTTAIFVDDYGDDAFAATFLATPAIVSGAIEVAGDQDWFSFSAIAGETYKFEIPVHDELTRLTLFGISAGGIIELDQDSSTRPLIAWVAPSDGPYFLSVENLDGEDIGNYELSVEQVIDDHGDDAANATLLNLPANISGSIELAGDRDWFRFDAIAGQRYRFEVPVHDESSELTLYDTDGTTQLEQDRFTRPSIVWDAPSDGVYFLSVEKVFSSSFGDYELSVELISDDHGDDAANATLLNLPASISGTIELAGDQDWFRFNAVAGETYRFEIPVHDESPELILYDTDGVTLLARDSFTHPSILWEAPSDGVYFLSAEMVFSSDFGNYELFAELVVDDHGDDATTASDLIFGSEISGSIELAGDQDWFRFNADAGETYRFEILDSDVFPDLTSTELTLYGTDGRTQLVQDGLSNPSILWTAPGNGTYYLSVASYFSNSVGNYVLAATQVVDDFGDNFLTASALGLPASISGSIEVPGDQDWFSFNASAGTAYRLAIPSSDIDAELALYGTNGFTELEREDFDPVIFWVAPSSGTYYLSVEPRFTTDAGDYELSVTAHVDVHGDNFADATLLSVPANVSSAIETVADQDWFRFNTVAGETYRFTIPESDEFTELTLYDTDGSTQLEQDSFTDATIVWVAPSSSTYYLSVEDVFSDIGGYELSATLLTDDHGDDAVSATLLSSFPVSISGSIEVAGDQDWFRFTATAGTKFEFSVPVHDEPTDLILYDTDGTTQLERDRSTDPTIVWTAPTNGTYYLAVGNSFTTRFSNYELSVAVIADDHGGNAALATAITFPANILGSIEVTDDQDWFSFSAIAGTKFEFAVPVHDQSPELILYGTDGTTQLERDLFSNPTIIWSAPSDGIYYLSVENFSSAVGNYELTAATIEDDHSDTPAAATPYDVPSDISGSIEVTGDQDWFQFDAIAGLTYDFRLDWAGEGSGELSLFDTDGTTVLVRDSFSPEFTWDALESGTYFLVAEGVFTSSIGDYELFSSSALQETTIAFDSEAYLTPNQVTVELIDGTGFAPGSTLTVESSSGDSETLTITSTGIVFSTTLSTADALANPNDGILQVASGDRLVASYFDADQGFGGRFVLETASIFVDDHGDRDFEATFIDSPATASGVIEVAGDVDWFRFPALAGLEYVFETSVGSLDSTSLILYDTNGASQLLSDFSRGGSQLTWEAPASGQYFLEVRSFVSSGVGSYELSTSINPTLFVEDVIVSSTQFASEFIDVIGGGNQHGYSLLGAHQLESLPWMNIDTFYLQFSEDVSASLSADYVLLTGTHGGTYDLVLASYDSASNTAEFRINGSINTDSFAISIFDGSITNALGLELDGDWTSGQADPSGDGTAGGQFDFYFNVLVGDEDGSGQVNSVDAFNVFASNTYATDHTNYRRDIDGSGQVNSADAFAVMANNTIGLPAAPAAPVAPATASTVLVDDHGDDFSSVPAIVASAEHEGKTEGAEKEPVVTSGTDAEVADGAKPGVVAESRGDVSVAPTTTPGSPQTLVAKPLSTVDRDAFFSEPALLTVAQEVASSFELELSEQPLVASILSPTVPIFFALNATVVEAEAQDDAKRIAKTDDLREIQGLSSEIATPIAAFNLNAETRETLIDLTDLSEEDKKRRQFFETVEDFELPEFV